MDEESTQPSTFPMETNDRNRASSNLSLQDELDIICLLRPCSRAAFDIAEKVATKTPQHVLHSGEIPQRYRKVIEMADEVEHRTRQSPVESGPEVTPDMTEVDMMECTENGVADIALRLSSRVNDMDMGFVFGRDHRKCDIVLPVEDRTAARISGMHFRIFLNDNGMIMLEDTSTNGTLVDNFLLKNKHPLPGNSVRRIIQKGSVVAVFVKSDKTTARFIVDIPQRRDEMAWRKKLEAYVSAIKKARHQKLVVLKNLGSDKNSAQKAEQAQGCIPGSQAPDEKLTTENLFITAGTTLWNHGMRWNGGGRFNIIAKLGSGAFATVYKLVDSNTGDELAAKEIEKRRFMKNGVLDMKITSELDILKRLKHPHVIESFDHVDTPRDLYILMELVPYGDLSIHVGTPDKLSDKDMRLVAKQMCQALAYLHDNGIAHRDIKPENIIKKDISPLWIKLADFGLSKIITQDDHHTAYQTFCGTLLYCAPEVYPGFAQKRAGLPPDPRTTKPSPYSTAVDIWSLAAVLFHLLCDKPPYEASAANHGIHMLDTIFEERFPRTKFDSADVHSDWELFFENTLQLTAQQRWSARRLLKMPWMARVMNVASTEYKYQRPDKDFALEEDSSDEEMEDINNFLEGALYPLPDASQLSLNNDPQSDDDDEYPSNSNICVGNIDNNMQNTEGLGIEVKIREYIAGISHNDPSVRYNLRSQTHREVQQSSTSNCNRPIENNNPEPSPLNNISPPLHVQSPERLFGEITESGVFGSATDMPRIVNAVNAQSSKVSTDKTTHSSDVSNANISSKHSLNDEEPEKNLTSSVKRSKVLSGHQHEQEVTGKLRTDGSHTVETFLPGNQTVHLGNTARNLSTSISHNGLQSHPFVAPGASMTNSSRPSSPRLFQSSTIPALGILTPSSRSVPVDSVLLTGQETQYGRAPECTYRYPDRMDTRVPKSAFTIRLHNPAEEDIEETNDWTKVRFYAVIGTRCSGHILINNIPMTRNKTSDEENMQLGLIQSGDVIEVFDKSDSHLRFHVRFYFGAAAETRDKQQDPFKVLLGRKAILHAIAEKESRRSDQTIRQ